MKESIWGYMILVLGILAIGIIWFFANTTRTDQHNYNLLKETTESAMIDALDLSYYRQTGNIRIEEEKFVENFIRRFAANADLSNEQYVIEIFDINTEPPKVSLRVSSKQKTDATGEIVEFDIVNNIDAILETKYEWQSSETFERRCYPVNHSSYSSLHAGDMYKCEVAENIEHNFYVLSYDSSSVTLIMDRTIGRYIYIGGRVQELANATSDWQIPTRLPYVREILAATGNSYNRNAMQYTFSNRYSWLADNLPYYGRGYWVEDSDRINLDWCIYGQSTFGSIRLGAQQNVLPYDPDCGVRPVITLTRN